MTQTLTLPVSAVAAMFLAFRQLFTPRTAPPLSTIWAQGFAAFEAGATLDACPYDGKTKQDWQAGWQSADESYAW